MKINWKNLFKSDQDLDYYSLTITDGKILSEKTYYKVKSETIVHTEDVVFDFLISHGIIKCFSLGYDSEKSLKKYDMQIHTNYCDFAYKAFEMGFPFFDIKKVEDFRKIKNSNKWNLVNYIIGAKQLTEDNEIYNVCLYFKVSGELKNNFSKDIITNLTEKLMLKENNMVIPTGNSSCWLHIIALDFTKDGFKIKFYFGFNTDYNKECLLSCFNNNANYNVVKKAIELNGFLQGFQVAVDEKSKVSYNFYFKPFE